MKEGRKPRRTRAITETAKQARRAALLSAAARLFALREYDAVSVDEIARAAGVAKGTLYLYFGTKEALFLELVAEEMRAWVRESGGSLLKRGAGPAQAATAVASTLLDRPALIRLLALLHAVLERNLEASSLRAFKHRLLEITSEAAVLLEKALNLKSGTGMRVVLWMHALIVGLAQMTAPSPVLMKVLTEDDGLAAFRLDFRAEIESSLTTMFVGAVETFGAEGQGGFNSRPVRPSTGRKKPGPVLA